MASNIISNLIVFLTFVLVAKGENVNIIQRKDGMSLMDPRGDLRDQQAVLTHDVLFQQVGKLYPHENTLLVRSSLSYSTLGEVPAQTRKIVALLDELSNNLTETRMPPPRTRSLKIPKYLVIGNGTFTINMRQARRICKNHNMRLLAPRNITELNAAANAYTEMGYSHTSSTRVWIDTDFDIRSAQIINPISQRPIGDIYKERIEANLWRYLKDDHYTLIALKIAANKLEYLKIKDIGGSMNSQQWYWINGHKEPKASVMCQGFGLDDHQSSISGVEMPYAKMYYARANSILPRREIHATRLIFQAIAINQQNRYDEIILRYSLNQPLLDDTPEKDRYSSPQIQIPELVERQRGPMFDIVASEEEESFIPAKRNKRDLAEIAEGDVGQLGWNVAKSLPIVGPFMGTIHDIMKLKQVHAFRQATKENLEYLYSEMSTQAREISEIKFGEREIRTHLTTIENEMDWMYEVMANMKLYLEVNAVVDRLRTKVMIMHTEYLTQTERFERWISQMLKGKSPEELYSGEILKELRSVLADKGLNVKAAFQDTESMIIPNTNRTQSVVILSSIRASGPPWTIYSVRSLPRYYRGRLFREKIESQFIAIDQKYTGYVTLTEQQAQLCKNELCEIKGPIRSLAQGGCGTIALTGDPSKLDCPVEDLTPSPDGYFENVEGGLLYSIPEGKTPRVTITCPYENPDLLQYEWPSGRGLLLVKPGCQVSLSGGDVYPHMPGSDYAIHYKKAINSLFTASAELGRLKKAVESKIRIIEVTTDLANKAPQIALFATVGAGFIMMFILACCILKLKNRATRIKNLFWSGLNADRPSRGWNLFTRMMKWCKKRKHDKLSESQLTTPEQASNSHVRPRERVDEGISMYVNNPDRSAGNISTSNAQPNPQLTSSPWDDFTKNITGSTTAGASGTSRGIQRENTPLHRSYTRPDSNKSDRVSLTRDMLYPA